MHKAIQKLKIIRYTLGSTAGLEESNKKYTYVLSQSLPSASDRKEWAAVRQIIIVCYIYTNMLWSQLYLMGLSAVLSLIL
jgi:hypothetical protein